MNFEGLMDNPVTLLTILGLEMALIDLLDLAFYLTIS